LAGVEPPYGWLWDRLEQMLSEGQYTQLRRDFVRQSRHYELGRAAESSTKLLRIVQSARAPNQRWINDLLKQQATAQTALATFEAESYHP
jgi:hypothetical protein